MSLTLSIAMVIIISIMLFIPEGKLTMILWNVCRGLLPASAVFSVLMFSMFGNESCTDFDNIECSTSTAGIINSLNVFILIGCTVLCSLAPPPPEPVFAVSIRLSKNVNKEKGEGDASESGPSKQVVEAVEIEVKDGKPVIKQEIPTNSSPETNKSNRPGKHGDTGIDGIRPPTRDTDTNKYIPTEGEYEA